METFKSKCNKSRTVLGLKQCVKNVVFLNTGVYKKGISLLFYFHNGPCNKNNQSHVGSAANQTALPRKLKIAPRTLPTVAGNVSATFPERFLRTSASLFNHFFFRSTHLLMEIMLKHQGFLLLQRHLQ